MTAPDHMSETFKNCLHETGHPHMGPPANPGRFISRKDRERRRVSGFKKRARKKRLASRDNMEIFPLAA